MTLDIRIANDEVCARLRDLQNIWSRQHKALYMLATSMANALAEKPTVYPFDFIQAAKSAYDDLNAHVKLPDLIRNKKILDYTPNIAYKTCPEDFAKLLRVAYEGI